MYAKANSIAKAAKKYAAKMATLVDEDHYQEEYERHFETQVSLGIKEHITTMKIFSRLEEATAEYLSEKRQWYFITIRPDESKIDFKDFYKKVAKFVNRACIEDYHLSLEQKGTDVASMGKGFHVHIIAKAKWRSKAECLRDSQSSFVSCTAANCVQVLTTKNPMEIVQNYLIDYKSDDGHKEVTKAWDEAWRKTLQLLPHYSKADNPLTGVLAPLSEPLSSPGKGSEDIIVKWT